MKKSKGSKRRKANSVFYLNLSSRNQTKHKLFAETCGFKIYKRLKYWGFTFFDKFLPESFLRYLVLCALCKEEWLSGQRHNTNNIWSLSFCLGCMPCFSQLIKLWVHEKWCYLLFCNGLCFLFWPAYGCCSPNLLIKVLKYCLFNGLSLFIWIIKL